MFGIKEFNQTGYPTPTEIPDETTCLTLNIPASDEWWAIITGLLISLNMEWNWQQYEGGLAIEDAAAAWQVITDQALDRAAITNTCPADTVETPYWDDAEDVDDDAPSDDQPWYGYVTDPTVPPAELDFVENALIWGFTGLIALATPELGFAPAILFHTIAPKFLIAQKAGDVGEIIRIILDGQDAALIDTTGHAGEIIETPIYPAESEDGHDIMIVQVS